MKAFDALQSLLDRYIAPVAEKLNSNQAIRSFSAGMMYTMPITLGVCALAVLVNLPIEAWQAFLTSTNLSSVANQVINVTMSMTAIYIVAAIAYNYAKAKGVPAMTATLVMLGVFLVLVPLQVEQLNPYESINMINTTYLGSIGIFPAILVGLGGTAIYCELMKHMQFKLPPTVPSMVSDSLSPVFVAMTIFTVTFLAKWGLTFTPWGNLFDMINTVIGTPVMHVGSSPLAVILVYWLSCVFFFFGIHPSSVISVFRPVMSVAMVSNIEAFMGGTAPADLPYLAFSVVSACLIIGGSANAIGLALSMLHAKSERYKALAKVAVVPALFNISEPMMFGFPVVLNPSFLIPMLVDVPICGFAAWGLVVAGLGGGFNPTITVPWIMPGPITGFLQGGFGYMVIILAVIVIATAVWYPFFKSADNMAVKEEQEAAEKLAAEDK